MLQKHPAIHRQLPDCMRDWEGLEDSNRRGLVRDHFYEGILDTLRRLNDEVSCYPAVDGPHESL